MSAFDAALDHLFEDQNLAVDALWRLRGIGSGLPVRVVVSAPDRSLEWRQAQIVVEFVFIEVRVSDVEKLARGDSFEVDGVVYVVTGDPVRDELRSSWKAEAREQ